MDQAVNQRLGGIDLFETSDARFGFVELVQKTVFETVSGVAEKGKVSLRRFGLEKRLTWSLSVLPLIWLACTACSKPQTCIACTLL